jgi:hypothetical protein
MSKNALNEEVNNHINFNDIEKQCLLTQNLCLQLDFIDTYFIFLQNKTSEMSEQV